MCTTADDVTLLRDVRHSMNYEENFLWPLKQVGPMLAAISCIHAAIDTPCDILKVHLKEYAQNKSCSHQRAAIKAFVFYRRHSPELVPHLRSTEVHFYETTCDMLCNILRSFNYSISSDSVTP